MSDPISSNITSGYNPNESVSNSTNPSISNSANPLDNTEQALSDPITFLQNAASVSQMQSPINDLSSQIQAEHPGTAQSLLDLGLVITLGIPSGNTLSNEGAQTLLDQLNEGKFTDIFAHTSKVYSDAGNTEIGQQLSNLGTAVAKLANQLEDQLGYPHIEQ